MKLLTLALFLGQISAADLAMDEATNALKIEVSPNGQRRIENRIDRVARTIDKYSEAKPVQQLGHSLKKFAHTKEVAHIKEIDEKFMKSPLGKRLVKEWTDVGKVLEQNLQPDQKDGRIRFPNDKIDELSDELDDVADTYVKVGKSRWAKKYEKGWEAAFKTEEAHQVAEDFHDFRHSHAGNQIAGSIKRLKNAIKKNVKVTDVPEEWQNSQAEMLKIDVTPEGQKEIEKELTDVARTAKSIKHSKPVRRVKKNLKKWAHTPEVQELKELDRRFLRSPKGQKLLKEWKEFGEALKTHVHKTKTGIHIDNDALQQIEKEGEDVGQELESIKHTKWQAKFDAAFEKATTTPQAEKLGKSIDKFGKSRQWHRLETQLKELDASLKKNVKVTDVPESMDLTNALKIEIEDDGVKEIEEEFADVEETWNEIKDSEPVQNLGNSLDELAKTQEAQALDQLNKDFAASPEGQQLDKEVNDFFQALDQHITETDNGIHIDNEAIKIIEGEADDVEQEFKELEKSHWAQDYSQAFDNLGKTYQAARVNQFAQEFEQSEEGHQMDEDLKDLGEAIEENVHVSDVPEEWESQDTLYLF